MNDNVDIIQGRKGSLLKSVSTACFNFTTIFASPNPNSLPFHRILQKRKFWLENIDFLEIGDKIMRCKYEKETETATTNVQEVSNLPSHKIHRSICCAD